LSSRFRELYGFLFWSIFARSRKSLLVHALHRYGSAVLKKRPFASACRLDFL
jgi:hypothetical protein